MLHCFLLPAGQEEGQEALEAVPVATVLSLRGFNLAVLVYSCRVVLSRTAKVFFLPSTPNPEPSTPLIGPKP